ncbi:decaprenyl-phosphate phosphoribosyltransferase [Clostridium perfringens]|uniref:Decaprenyl-phosphate phosphoribosyltransferase n=1 Tax=Clostridium perfringens TaxID=1502 RepID=A0AAW9I8N5_CLOPF|nr:decaprenyl-phosphate phosphoribosyltransferase [Clostridium perfringens]MBI6000954.1 decaprenyl-phosphate phosphoribosyltransferase [Clostridium perfringens]MBI6027232.1 decaprenyl-phosphate phosphoribosyltransferase [Clostridium perfringens]MBI6108706.1 decaprenyl-phosphate phosphoribosyltransferase [Clostridium perfringens]MDK0571227.1 decaprenyl-phosphate phosphoribosyltransferase [Clostridium perfringens]MDK0692784.1 decaprenyl-phosphate phosphoribosyltransferase [Clostridium perfringen
MEKKENNCEKLNNKDEKSFIINLLKLMRPKQWIKNFFVFGALIFSYSFLNLNKTIYALISFLLFCLISSTVYIMNDILDVEKDRVHPKKRFRPIASGAISIKQATIALVVLLAISMLSSFMINKSLFFILVLYFINNIFYSFKIKNIVILDVISIAVGFILRVIAGGVAIDVSLSGWILLCTFFISLFLGFEKRRNEIIKLEGKANEHRKILDDYSDELLKQFSDITLTCTVISYAMYTFVAYENAYMMITNIFVVYGLFRYKYLSMKKGQGGSPTETVMTDKSIIIDVILWVITSVVILLYLI